MTRKREDGRSARPLYVQAYDRLKAEIQDGVWRPGEMLPNEFELGAMYGVSQGTMRKALAALAEDHVLERRQGLGTFVSAPSSADVLFRFFQFREPSGQRVVPESRTLKTTRGKANAAERARLALRDGARVIRHARVRSNAGRPFIHETVVLPEVLFPGLGEDGGLPNTLYDLFQREYRVTVARASEKLSTVAAAGRTAALLDIAPGTPLLRIDRQTLSLDNRIVEWRLSLCHLGGLHYEVEIG